MLTAHQLHALPYRAGLRGDLSPEQRRPQPFRFAPAGRSRCLAGASTESHSGWLSRWQIPFRPRHREWVVPVLVFLTALGFQLRQKVSVQHTRPWQPVQSAGALERTEALAQLPYDPQNFPLTEDDAVRDVLVSDGSMPAPMALQVADTISREAKALGYDPFLALAIMHVESKFRPDALSQRGAEGLMQVMPKTQRWLLSMDPTLRPSADPMTNVRLGMRYFGSLQRSFGRLDLALQAYNCGPGRLLEAMKDASPLPFETEMYAQRVLHRYKKFRSDYEYIGARPHPATKPLAAHPHTIISGRHPVGP